MTLPPIPPLDLFAGAAARRRLNSLAKPPGSLGRLEELAVRLAEITGSPAPSVKRKCVILCAGDHGVARHGISAAPSAVTALMVGTFLKGQTHGGAAINVLTRRAGARLVVADAGVAVDLGDLPGLVKRNIRRGTADLSETSAMTRDEAARCIQLGLDLVEAEAARGLDLVAPGDMGIGNTTPAAAMTAAMTGLDAQSATGRGTGISDEAHARKTALVAKALALHQPDPKDALGVLAQVGGCEIGAMAGVFLGAASRRIPAVVDGYIAAAAALIACGLNPACRDYLLPSHLSVEPGHRAAMAHLRLTPLFDLGMRLGEGTGAALAFPLIDASADLLTEMATLEDLGIKLP